MSTDCFEQQPIARTVGRLTRVPKRAYRHASHDEMERDQVRWQTAAMVETVRARG